MFESDDYDQILSQFDFPNLPKGNELKTASQVNIVVKETLQTTVVTNIKEHDANSGDVQPEPKRTVTPEPNSSLPSILKPNNSVSRISDICVPISTNKKVSPKQSKRKIIDSHFDYTSKRKFPGPAGLLTGSLQESKDESVCQIELFSQDIDLSQNSLKRGLFDLPIWIRLKEDIVQWNLVEVDTIKCIKQQALAGNLRKRKAQTVTAFVETVDRSATDPLIVLRDTTGNIKCTLHRHAWSLFSPYLVAEQCALVLWKPTVLTTGSAFKKHYLNITLSNIYAIFSSALLNEEEIIIPEGYVIDSNNNFTIIRIKESPDSSSMNLSSNNHSLINEQNLMDDLDSIFSDDIF